MEQPNMMQPNGMPPQNMSRMQQAQSGNPAQQIHAKIIHELQQNMNQVGTGWQSTFDLKQRAARIFQLFTQLRLLNADAAQCLRIAIPFELKTIQNAANQDVYDLEIKRKLNEITAKRAQQASVPMPNGMQMNPNMVMPNNLQNSGMANMTMQNGGMGMPNGQMNVNAIGQQNLGFPAHLQRQMQPSQLPLAQQPNTMDPSALQSNPMQAQMSDVTQGQPQQLPIANPGGQGGPPSSQVPAREVQALARTMYSRMTEDQRNTYRTNWLSSLDDQTRARISAMGGQADPLLTIHLMNKARGMIASKANANQQQQNNGGMQLANQQTMMGSNGSQTPVSQVGGPGIDLSGILGQQASALKQQESGEQVVPASNNASFNLGGAGMNIPQGINPQMLGNQQGNGQQMSNQMQQMVMQQQKQQMIQQRQNALAQQQALQQQHQANQLRGQPGGLNAPNALNGGPAAQINSPAMSMLNRPMVPPGQPAPGTPQQNRPPGQPPQTPQNAAAMNLMQHHQQMMNQNNQSANHGSQGAPQQDMMQLLSTLPDGIRRKAIEMNIPPDKIRSFVQMLRHQSTQAGNTMNVQLGANGLPAMGIPTPQMGNPQAGMNGMPGQNIQGNATPMFNSQPPPNQQPQAPQMDPMQVQQRLQQQQHYQLRQRAMDSRPFPKVVLNQISVSVPQEVQSWGKLKNHLVQNQSVLPPQVLEKVKALQLQYFSQNQEELSSAMTALKQYLQQQGQRQAAAQMQPQQPPVSGPQGMHMQNGQAPPAQMVPPAAPMQQPQPPNHVPGPQGVNPVQIQQPTMQDVQLFRQKIPQAANYPDEQIRQIIWTKKKEAYAQQMQQSQQQEVVRNMQQMQRTQAGTGQQGGIPNVAQVQRQPQQPPMQGPPGQQQSMGAHAQGQKRAQPSASTASNDDVMEIPNPNAPPQAQMGAPQAPPMQQSKSQQQGPQQGPRNNMQGPTKEQLAQMPPERRAQILQLIQQQKQRELQNEALRRAQMGIPNNQQPPPNAPQAHGQQQGSTGGMALPLTKEAQQQALHRVLAMAKELERTTVKGAAVEIDSEGLQQAQAILKRLWKPTVAMQSTFGMAVRLPNFDMILQQALKAKVMIAQNVANENGEIRDYLSMTIQQLRGAEATFNTYFRLVGNAKKMEAERGQPQLSQPQQQNGQPVPLPPQAHAQAQAQGQQRPPSTVAKPQHSSQQPTATTSQKAPGKKASHSSKAPPAPTDNKSFDWPGGAPSPHGVPKYEHIGNELTSDKLKFPPAKKRKPNQPNSQASTPAAQMGTPGAAVSPNGIAKAPSPELTKKQQQQVKQEMVEREREEQWKWRCDDSACEASIKGFGTEEELRRHTDTEHIAIEDPLAFLLENAASALGVDQNGNALPANKQESTADVKVQPRGTPASSARLGIKQESATPPVSGLSAKSKGKTVVTSAPQVAIPAKEKTLREALEEQLGYRHAADTDDARDVSMANIPAAEDDLFASSLHETLSGIAGVDDWPPLGENNMIDWGLPQYPDSSPEPTPSDSTASSGASTISQSERLRINMEWDAFGNGDTHVPDALKMQSLGLHGSPEQGKGGDLTELTGAPDKEGNKQVDDLDWSRDELNDWDTLFGPTAGLDGFSTGMDAFVG